VSTQPPDPETVRRFQDNDDESVEHEDKRAIPAPPETEDSRRKKVESQLDDALAATFPASDPVSIVTPQHEEDWGEPRAGERAREQEQRRNPQHR
jgi:hypothetical protein